MSTRWTVTAAAERVVLDERRRGETTFTVTNPGPAADRAVFDVVPGEGADGSWFTVEEPQRLVRGGASVSYAVKVMVPPEVAPGAYQAQGLVYSADSAPEESSVLSPRVVLEVPAEEEPPRRRWPWWWFAVAVGVVVVLAVVIGLVLAGGDDEVAAVPTPAPTGPPVQGVMPDVTGLTEAEALRVLSERGIAVRPIKYLQDPERASTVVGQRVEAGEVVNPAHGVTLVVAADLTAPVLTGPEGVVEVPRGGPAPELVWDPGSTVARQWVVTVRVEECGVVAPLPRHLYPYWYSVPVTVSCQFTGSISEPVESPSAVLEMPFPDDTTVVPGAFATGWYEWYVEPVDDFLNRGERSEPGYFRIRLVQG